MSPVEYNRLQEYRESPIKVPDDGLSGIDETLRKAGYIETDDELPDSSGGLTSISYKITEEGLWKVSEYEQQRNDVETSKRQIRYQNIILTATLIISLISLFKEHILSMLGYH